MKRAFSAGSSIIEEDALSRTGRMERLLDLAMKDRLWRKRPLKTSVLQQSERLLSGKADIGTSIS